MSSVPGAGPLPGERLRRRSRIQHGHDQAAAEAFTEATLMGPRTGPAVDVPEGVGALSPMPGGGLILHGGPATEPASAASRKVDLEVSRMNILFILSQLAERPEQWEATLRGIVAAYDEMDADALAQAEHPGPRSPVDRVAANWRTQDRDRTASFGPLYHKLKKALYGEPAAAEKGRDYE